MPIISCTVRRIGLALVLAGATGGSLQAHSLTAHPQEAPFLAENAAAMDTMMADMAVTPTGDIDRDFVAMMVPHHQGAIDMAKAVLRYGHNQQIRRLAQEIIVTQQQEIIAMRLAVDETLPPPAAAPTQGTATDTAAGNGTNHPHHTTEQ